MKGFENERKELVEHLEKIGSLKNPEIKKAMLKVKRELFVTSEYRFDAYVDMALPIVGGATISQPYVYAITFEALKLKKGEKVLEVGSGSGYGAALISELVGKKGKTITVEIVPEVCDFAKSNLKKAGYKNVKVVCSDGSIGYEKEAPYDAIIVTAACPEIPKSLVNQLKNGGRLVAPVGGISTGQDLIFLEKDKNGEIKTKTLGGVIFLPLTGKHGYKI
ncbi:MAG TPA: protein-L-isoaspartate(D-aspartate) O-methyltransferase [archaeon]|nr:protein-L-isoaspartate(D-aspartate) O-methyltransferase [archaeon]